MFPKKKLSATFVVLSIFINILVGSAAHALSTEADGAMVPLASYERACKRVSPLYVQKKTVFAAARAQQAEKQVPTLSANVVFDIVNTYREKAGYELFVKDEALCALARERQDQLYGEIITGRIHAGFASLDLPFWATENMKFGTSEKDVVEWWLSSPIHRAAIYSDNVYSCGACRGHVCIQLFSSFEPKVAKIAQLTR